jgi:hypothetical protein
MSVIPRSLLRDTSPVEKSYETIQNAQQNPQSIENFGEI